MRFPEKLLLQKIYEKLSKNWNATSTKQVNILQDGFGVFVSVFN